MITLSIRAAQGGFFDRATVIKAAGAATRKNLSKAGAFVRQRAKTSIRKRKGVSPPAGPPYSHTGLLRKFLYFSYDQARESVVIGPAKINGVVSPTALPALEMGGRSVVEDRKGKKRPIRVKARPFMGPALRAEAPNFPNIWRDSVR